MCGLIVSNLIGKIVFRSQAPTASGFLNMANNGVDLHTVLLHLKKIIRINRRCRSIQLAINNLVLRRRRLLSVCLLVLLLLLSQRNVITRLPRRRSCGRLGINAGLWQNVWHTYSDTRFKKTFGISRRTFVYILNRVRHQFARQSLTKNQ